MLRIDPDPYINLPIYRVWILSSVIGVTLKTLRWLSSAILDPWKKRRLECCLTFYWCSVFAKDIELSRPWSRYITTIRWLNSHCFSWSSNARIPFIDDVPLNIPTVQMTSPLIIVLFNHNLTNDNPINNAIYTWLSHGKKIILWSHLRLQHNLRLSSNQCLCHGQVTWYMVPIVIWKSKNNGHIDVQKDWNVKNLKIVINYCSIFSGLLYSIYTSIYIYTPLLLHW